MAPHAPRRLTGTSRAVFDKVEAVATVAGLLGWDDPAIAVASAVAANRHKDDPHGRFESLGALVVERLAERLRLAGLDEEAAEELAHELDLVAKPENRRLLAAINAGRNRPTKRKPARTQPTQVEGGDHEPVEPVDVEVGRALRPGTVELSVTNGHATVLDKYPWSYRAKPSAPLRELMVADPDLVEGARLALPRAHREAAAADATPVTIEVLDPAGIEGYLEGLPPNLDVPGWHGLTLPRDWTAPTLIYGPSGVGKSWVVAGIIDALAGDGLRSLVLATEGGWEWAHRLTRYPVERRPALFPGCPDREAIDRLVPVVDDAGIDLIIVDVCRPMFRRLEVSENDSEAVDAVLGHLEPLRADGRFLALVHHEGKDSELGPRGSSALGDQAGLMLHIDHDEDGDGLCIVSPEKWRSGPLDSQPTLKAFFRRGGAVGAERYSPPDPAEERALAIVGALAALGEGATVTQLRDRIRGVPGGRVTAAELHALAAEQKAHTHPHPGRSNQPVWMAGPPADCCPE